MGSLSPSPTPVSWWCLNPFSIGDFPCPPTSSFGVFFRFYGIELVHLNPNSILHIAAFIHLCEAFLGVELHFALFLHLFSLRLLQKSGQACVVGGAALHLRYGRADKYLGLAFKNSLKGWHNRWFYISNLSPSLPAYVGRRLEQKASWLSTPSFAEMRDVQTLLKRLKDCKILDEVSAVGVVRSFIGR